MKDIVMFLDPKGGGKIVGLNRVKDWPALTLLNPARLKWNLPHFVRLSLQQRLSDIGRQLSC